MVVSFAVNRMPLNWTPAINQTERNETISHEPMTIIDIFWIFPIYAYISRSFGPISIQNIYTRPKMC